MRKIQKLGEALLRLGLIRESKRVFNLAKIAVPIVEDGIFRLNEEDEPIGEPDEEDYEEDGSKIEAPNPKPISPPERERTVLRDSASRVGINPQNDLKNWYAGMKETGDWFILIPFDRKKLTDEMIYAMAYIWDVDLHSRESYDIYREPKHKDLYGKLREKITMHGAEMTHGGNVTGSLERLKKVFPALWSDIKSSLDKSDLGENDVIYMFYNQQTNPGRFETFTKDSFFLPHDLGHADFDSREDYGFKGLLNMFIMEISKYYVTDWDAEKKNMEEAIGSMMENGDDFGDILAYFFNNPSNNPEDIYADIWAAAAGGSLLNELEIPRTFFNVKGQEYELDNSADNEEKVRNAYRNLLIKIKNYMNNKWKEGAEKQEYGSGPFTDWKGEVVLHDL